MKTTFALLSLSTLGTVAVAQPFELQFLHNLVAGMNPLAPLVQAEDGNFYGTTQTGGNFGRGIIFKMTPEGSVSTFIGFDGPNGYGPSVAPLISDGKGNLCGTTLHGGNGGRGTVFKVTLAGVLITLVHFDGSNGSSSHGLTIDSAGNLYGTTVSSGFFGDGTVFKVATDSTFTTLVRFPSGYGSYPAALTLSRDGNLYGGTYNGSYGNGTVFRVTPDGGFTTVADLSGRESAYSTALTEGNDGNFYGTAMKGGSSGVGTAFRVTPDGVVTTLVNFNWDNGALPTGPLTLGRDGNFYGTTIYGGEFEGTVFRMTVSGELTTLAHFKARATGVRPYGGVIFGTDGNLYGTTAVGGSLNHGTIFRVVMPLDIDGDAVPDAQDQCPGTALLSIVNEHGCSIDQLVPCAGPTTGLAWKNHGQYIVTAAEEVRQFLADGLLTPAQADEILATAIHSDCGKR
jgi:uncharacterized repeat protein (TIGR03803 family)